MAGALLFVPVSARAQVVPPPVGETPIPVKPKTDSASADTTLAKADTIQPPIGRFADPVLYEIGPQYEWNRAQLFATGALTLADLLDRIPLLTTYRSGWLATPQSAAFNGDFQRIRIFYDGVEIDNLDPATGGILDLSTVQIWSLERVSIERSASEVRVHLRSWRVDNTTPYTRVDVATGNEETNLYRGYYGKRFGRGQVLQFAGQEYGVTSSRFAGSGDALSLLARAGIGRDRWSIDGFLNRTHATRVTQRPAAGRPPIPALDGTHSTAYVRAAIGGADSGPWAQMTAASLRFKGTELVSTVDSTGATVTDTAALSISEAQYNLSAGYTLGAARLELRDRFRALGGRTYNAMSARLDFVTRLGVLSGFAEHDGFRRTTNTDVGIRAQPVSFIALAGSLAQTVAHSGNTVFPSSRSARGEIGVKLLRPWLSVGVVTLDNAFVTPPILYDTLLRPVTVGRTNGRTVSMRGALGRGFGIDAFLTRWDQTRSYQPQYQSRSEINFANSFLRRFPKGDFEVRASGVFEYRGHNVFPLDAGDVSVGAAKTMSALLEIRIMRAVISYQQRNILAYQYQVIPGFEMSRVLAIYGVRWEFWN